MTKRSLASTLSVIPSSRPGVSMKESSLIKTLQELFSQHPMFEAKPLETTNEVLLPVCLNGTKMEYLAIRDGNPLLIVFNLVLEAQRFSETSTIKHAVREKRPSPYSHDAYHSLIRALELDPCLIDAEDIFDALVTVATSSRMQRLVPCTEDAPWVSKLREYNQAKGEWELQTATNEVLETINSTNIDLVMSGIPELDPWCEQDPENPLGTELILLSDLMEKHRIHTAQAGAHLKRLRKDYVTLTGNWQAEIDEIDYLLALVDAKPN